MEVSYGGTDGGRIQGGNMRLAYRGNTGRWGPGDVQWTERPGDIEGLGDQGGVPAMSGWVGGRVSEDCGGDEVSEDHAGAWRKEETNGAVEVKRWNTAEILEVCGNDGATIDQGRVDGMMELGGTDRTVVPGGA